MCFIKDCYAHKFFDFSILYNLEFSIEVVEKMHTCILLDKMIIFLSFRKIVIFCVKQKIDTCFLPFQTVLCSL